MSYLSRFAALGVLTISLLLPLSTSALIPVGGKVIFKSPCIGGIYMVVANPFGLGSGSYVFTPGSIPFPYGLPILNSWVLGNADTFVACKPYGGFRITFLGSWFGVI